MNAVVRRLRVQPAALGLNLLTYVIALFIFFPILWTVLTAFKSEADAAAIPPVFVFHVTLDNFRAVFNANYLSFFQNTVKMIRNAIVPMTSSSPLGLIGLNVSARIMALDVMSYLP